MHRVINVKELPLLHTNSSFKWLFAVWLPAIWMGPHSNGSFHEAFIWWPGRSARNGWNTPPQQTFEEVSFTGVAVFMQTVHQHAAMPATCKWQQVSHV